MEEPVAISIVYEDGSRVQIVKKKEHADEGCYYVTFDTMKRVRKYCSANSIVLPIDSASLVLLAKAGVVKKR